jgi:hypothetical protein
MLREPVQGVFNAFERYRQLDKGLRRPMSEQEYKSMIWTRSTISSGSESNPILIGRRLSKEWLRESVSLTEIRFSGDLHEAMADLIEKSKRDRMNLPIASLRMALTAGIENVIMLDPDLGMNRNSRSKQPYAIVIARPASEDRQLIEKQVRKYLKRWMIETLEVWAKTHDMGEMAARATAKVGNVDIEFSDVDVSLVNNGKPNYLLIARTIGQRLIGEKLFEGLGECEIVAAPDLRSNSAELMTLPVTSQRDSSVFSMVARINVSSMPYSDDLYLGVSTMKRVWAKQKPKVSMHMPMRVNGYVMAVGRPALMVSVERGAEAWEFGDNYQAVRAEAITNGGALPETLELAVEQRTFDRQNGWWAGLPELPSLFRTLSQRSAFEADEVQLLQTVSDLLGSIIDPDPIPIREFTQIRSPKKSQQEMLKTEDLWGAAGDSLASSAVVDDMEDAEENEQDQMADMGRAEKLQRYREQNQAALSMMGEYRPEFIKLYCDRQDEKRIIVRAVETLFGDDLKVIFENLPRNTHGLRTDLDGNEKLRPRERFDRRVAAWAPATEDLKKHADGKPAIALICAPERYGTKMEDPVNYYAGIHAFSSVGANVHHVLPIENPENPKSRQAFLHRVQSAVMDVVMAHSGLVFNTQKFFSTNLPDSAIPKAVYGIQIVRSRARSRSGEQNVVFLLYTRLIIATGITEIQVVYKDRKTQRTEWMPLNRGLQWIGANRKLSDGDDAWLKANFRDETRETLNAIYADDPRAIVMIDWQTVASNWPGIRDEDLKSGARPKLDEIDLSVFKEMTFVRLRRGNDTLSLRMASRKVYEGWRDGQARERYIDEYFTTTKTLVEVVDDDLNRRNSGHFIATMGYAKTVQIKRGFSCYHPTSRIQRVTKGVKEFKMVSLEPADFDAALPAAMDVTVMQCHSDITPEQVAVIVMGLRLGYAHYNDWTTLPAPLFFKRKIEDYIIRFPEDEDASVTIEEVGDSSPQVTKLEELLAEELVEEIQEEPKGAKDESAPSDTVEDLLDVNDDDDDFDIARMTNTERIRIMFPNTEVDLSLLNSEALLMAARAMEMPVLPSHPDARIRRLYKRMMQERPGDVKVHVQLPFFVKTKGLFGPYTNRVRRNASAIWRLLRQLEYAMPKRPKDTELLDRLSERLLTPQAMIGYVMAGNGLIDFMHVREIIESTYNASVEDEFKITGGLGYDDYIQIMALADENRQDELMAWMIFSLVQFPPPDGIDPQIFRNMKNIPGPMTRDAIEYYIETCLAIDAAVAQKDRLANFQAVIRTRKNNQKSPEAIANSHVVNAVINAFVAEQNPENTNTDLVYQEDRTMEIKNSLCQTITQLTPGSVAFESDIASVNALIEELRAIHAEALEQARLVEDAEERMRALNAVFEEILAELNALAEELELSAYRYVPPEGREALEKSEQVVDDLKRVIAEIKEQQGLMENVTGSIKERKARTDQIYARIMEKAEELKDILAETPCVVPVDGIEPDPEDKDPVPEEPEQASETITQEPEEDPVPEPEPVSEFSQEIKDLITTQETPQVIEEVKAEIAAEAAAPALVMTAEILPPEPAFSAEAEERLPRAVQVAMDPEDDQEDQDTQQDILKTMEKGAETIRKAVAKRYYGLADVAVDALGVAINNSDDPGLHRHKPILKAMVASLYAMDCQFDFNVRLDTGLMTSIVEEGIVGCDQCEMPMAALGVLSAALPGMLFDPNTNQWNVANEIHTRTMGLPAVSRLVNHIMDIRNRSIQISRNMFRASHVSEKQAIENEIERIRKQAANWKDKEIFNGWKHRGYQRMHEEIYSRKGQIGQFLLMIEKNEADKLKAAYAESGRKLDNSSRYIDDVFRRIDRGRPDGPYRERSIENLCRTRELIERFLELHVQLKKPVSKNEIGQNYLEFVTRLHDHLEAAQAEIADIKTNNSLELFYKESALRAVDCALRLYSDADAPFCIPQDQQKLLLQLAMDQGLSPCIYPIDSVTPPLHLPAEVIDEVDRWVGEELYGNDDTAIGNALLDAMRGHIRDKRFLPAFRINQILAKNMTQDTGLQAHYNRERQELKDELQVMSQRVTHALSLDAVQTDKAHGMQWFIGEMQNALREEKSIGSPDNTLAAYPDFPQARACLKRNVTGPLEADIYTARENLRANLERLESERGTGFREDIRRVREMLKDKNAATLRTAHDAYMMLNQGQHLPERIAMQTDFAGLYDRFIKDILEATHNKPLLLTLCEMLRAEPSEDDPAFMKGMSVEQREQAACMIETWIAIFKHKSLQEEDSPLMQLFQKMGLTHDLWFANDVSRHRVQFNLDPKSFVFLVRDEDDFFVPPALGSLASHICGTVMEGNPNETSITKLLPEIGNTPTLVLAHMRGMNMEARARTLRGTTAILMDDYLICYIAMHPGRHLQALMQVATLTFSSNPYNDYGVPVPQEMFFGRRTELQRINEINSAGILFGGRRLGKSSLLAQIETERRNIKGDRAVYISMDTIDLEHHVTSAWNFIYQNLVDRKIIEPTDQRLTKAAEYQNWVERELQANKEIKDLFLLIDEADRLMGKELALKSGELGFVRTMQQMIENLRHTMRVRYLIAGLHNTARMANDENSVFGKVDSIALGPFNTREDIQRGIRLITKPLAAMGYLFRDDSQDLPLRILSVCNFYPAFIQLYCRELVHSLQNRQQSAKPPIYIEASDLDTVENNSELLTTLRRKFALNLDLDKRYRAIALILADVYYSEAGSGANNGLTTSEIREHCEIFAGQHFKGISIGVYEALLDEMCQLNILDRNGSRYILRNPGIAMMMGNQEQITAQLSDLGRMPAEEMRNQGDGHIKIIKNAKNEFLFPYPVGWLRRQMQFKDGQLIIAVGNKASGIVGLTELKRDDLKLGQNVVISNMPGSGPNAAHDEIQKRRRGGILQPKILAVLPQTWHPNQIEEFSLQANKASRIEMRIMLLATPDEALEIARKMDEGVLPRNGGDNWTLATIPPWTADSVYYGLSENINVAEDTDCVQLLLDATCGFGADLWTLCSKQLASIEDVEREVAKIRQSQGKDLASFYEHIGMPASFDRSKLHAFEQLVPIIDGIERGSSELLEFLESENISQGEFDFMTWMGLVQEGDHGKWSIPKLYLDLVNAS